MKDYHPEGTIINTDENKKYLSSEALLSLAQVTETILEAKSYC